MSIFNTQIVGKQPVVEALNVSPSTSAQTFTPSGYTDGFSPVNISPVTSAIDANIVAGNIKSGIDILGVTGNYSGPEYGIQYERYSTNNYRLDFDSVMSFLNKIGNSVTGSNNATLPRYAFYNAFYNRTDIIKDGITFYRINGTTSFQYMFSGCTGITGEVVIDACSGTSNLFGNTFQNCTGITSVKLKNTGNINTSYGDYSFNGCFAGCTGITSATIENLNGGSYNVFQYMFDGCTNLTTVSVIPFSNGSGNCFSYMFQNCTSLPMVTFANIYNFKTSNLFGNCFRGCTSLTDVYFPAAYDDGNAWTNNCMSNMLYGCSGVTIHFPSNVTNRVDSTLTGYPNFGGTNTSIVFDLLSTASLTATMQSSGGTSWTATLYRLPSKDTTTSICWTNNQYNASTSNAYYTSGLTRPSSGDNVYSDAECTRVAGTIN